VDRSNHQGGYGEAFTSVLAAAAGLRLAKPLPDIDGIDFCMWPDRTGLRGGARAIPINVQVKSDSVAAQTATHWSHRLEVPHFNVLAGDDVTLPTYLFLVIVPGDWRHYATAEPDGLLLGRAAYWHSLLTEDPIIGAANGAKKTVKVPKVNLLTVDSLRTLVSAPHAHVEAS
jgi:hypothetical protein